MFPLLHSSPLLQVHQHSRLHLFLHLLPRPSSQETVLCQDSVLFPLRTCAGLSLPAWKTGHGVCLRVIRLCVLLGQTTDADLVVLAGASKHPLMSRTPVQLVQRVQAVSGPHTAGPCLASAPELDFGPADLPVLRDWQVVSTRLVFHGQMFKSLQTNTSEVKTLKQVSVLLLPPPVPLLCLPSTLSPPQAHQTTRVETQNWRRGCVAVS